MKRFIAALAIYAVGLFAIGSALLPAKADAQTWFYAAKCAGPTKHTIYLTGNGVWKFLVPWCPYPYQHVGDFFRVAQTNNGPWRWIIPA